MDKIDISFIIPTLDKLEEGTNLQQVINSIYLQPTKYTYEICIYSQYKTTGPQIKWIEEKNKIGPLYGFNYSFKHGAIGEYIVLLVDDHFFISPFDNIIDALQSSFFQDRKYKICGLSTEQGNPCMLPTYGDRLGSILRLKDFGLPAGITMRFPVFHRDTITNLLDGYIFHPEFRYHAGDIWLGYYLSLMGEPGLECRNSRLKHIPTNPKNAEWEVQDCNTAYALIHNWLNGVKYYVAPERPLQSSKRYNQMNDNRPYEY